MTPAMALGVVLSLVAVPSVADSYGRKQVYLSSLLISLIAQLMLLLTDESEIAIALLFLIGATWPGKCIVGMAYALEFFPQSMQHALLSFCSW